MAQRTIHYLFGELLAKEIKIQDKNRFLFGSVLPDAYTEGSKRDVTHFRIKDEEYIYFDFEAFRLKYDQLISTDELYLGYYMHLIEDAFYRKYIQEAQLRMPSCLDEVAILHHDYHLLNTHVVNRYKIKDTIIIPENFEDEPICKLTSFSPEEFISDMANDFIETPTGTTCFLTEQNVDEFITAYLEPASIEMQAVKEGKHYLKVEDYRWKQVQS